MDTSVGMAAATLVGRLNHYNWALTKYQLALSSKLPDGKPTPTFLTTPLVEVVDELERLRREVAEAREAFRLARQA